MLEFGLHTIVLAAVGLCVHGYTGTGTEPGPLSHPIISSLGSTWADTAHEVLSERLGESA
ncbi:hypothetical protein GCM10011578_030880 [Streptomyces fuscichromogenes]|uniref:Uncharacterized protein n=1 Tax=Streptomyces fuscichromogenes TaxID=1324013 RepID=A0A918CR74_9ACTN|nr:hypothetical protein GCM10011578_030880 [Streptomyces fuscichromogenes]